MSLPPEIAARYAPGEDVRPLARAVLGALLGLALALVVDWGLAMGVLGRLVWPAVWANLVVGDPNQVPVGLATAAVLAVLAAVTFTYAQFRRFVPSVPALRGLAWGLVLWLAVAPLLLPRAAGWLAGPDGLEGPRLLLAASVVVLDTVAGLAVFGLIVGWLNPPPAA